jgi:prophage regulatory protein
MRLARDRSRTISIVSKKQTVSFQRVCTLRSVSPDGAVTMSRALLRLPALLALLGFGRAHAYSLVRSGLLMPPVRLGARSVAWPSDEADQYIDAKVRGATDAELRELVARLVAARAAANEAAV